MSGNYEDNRTDNIKLEDICKDINHGLKIKIGGLVNDVSCNGTGESDGLKEKSYFENWYESQTEIKERLTLEEVSFFINNRKFYDRPEIEVPHALKEMAILFEKRVKQARQDALEEVEKALMTKTHITECGIIVYAKDICDEITKLKAR